jgi:hypothetical protein
VKPQLPANFEAETWAKLQAAVQAVHHKQPVATSLEELYRVRGGSSSRQWHKAILQAAQTVHAGVCQWVQHGVHTQPTLVAIKQRCFWWNYAGYLCCFSGSTLQQLCVAAAYSVCCTNARCLRTCWTANMQLCVSKVQVVILQCILSHFWCSVCFMRSTKYYLNAMLFTSYFCVTCPAGS